jgi:ubiquinone/menaquinone biosynthesis C-methylase UbiE
MDKTRVAVELFNNAAGLYMQKYMDVSAYWQSLDLLCVQLPAGASILELACGPGNITAYLLHKRPDLRILGTDLAPEMLRLAAANNHTATFMELDLRNISVLNSKYDAVICGFGLPYLDWEQAPQLIKDSIGLLKTDGLLYFSFMEGDYSQSGLQRSSSGNELYIYIHEEAMFLQAIEGYCSVVHRSSVANATGFDKILVAVKCEN